MKLHFRLLLCMGMAGFLPACGTNIWNATAHPLTTPEQVKIYTQRPHEYERLGTVTHLGGLDPQWQQRTDATPVFTDLLSEAAAMGANGLLLVDDTTMADATASVNYHGAAYVLPIQGASNTIIVQAIFVKKE